MHTNSDQKSKVAAKIFPDVRCALKKCDSSYCQIKCKSQTGWVLRSNIWGVYDNETF